MSIITKISTKFAYAVLAALATLGALFVAPQTQPEAQAAGLSSLSSLSSSSSLPSLSSRPSVPSIPKPSIPSIPSVPSLPGNSTPSTPTHDAALPYRDRAAAIIRYTNIKRAEHGLAPITENVTLSRTVAQPWAKSMMAKNDLQHRPRHWEAYPSYIPAGGENILQAWSDYSDKQLVQLWYDSPGHRKIMLDPRAKSVGIGISIREDGKLYAVQNFAR